MTEHAAPLDDPPAPRVTDGLAKLGLALKQQGWRGANAQGLSPTQAQILILLNRHPGAPTRLGTLARDLSVTSATVSDAVRALEHKGLVRKDRDPADPRALALTLTTGGEQAARQAAGWPDFLLSAAETLTEDEQAVFLRGLTKMIRTLQQRGEIPPARMCVTCTYFRPNVHDDPHRPHHCAFVNAPYGDRGLRLDCAEHDTAPPDQADAAWNAYVRAP